MIAIGAAYRGAEAPAVAWGDIYAAEIEPDSTSASFNPFAFVAVVEDAVKDTGQLAEAAVVNA